jgi:RNA polymerase-binding transcription factor DksA
MQRSAPALAMSEKQYTELKIAMEQELCRILSQGHRLMATDGAGSRGESTTCDLETEPSPGDAIQRLKPRMQRRALQVLTALRRMRAGTYGICVACRLPIAYERLVAIPETCVCIHCSWNGELPSSV